MDIVKQKIKVQYSQYVYGNYSAGIQSHYILEDKENEVEVYDEENYTKLKELLCFKDLDFNKVENLEEGKLVYFMKPIDFPREVFRESFPNNKITYDPIKADIIIYDPKKLEDSCRETYRDRLNLYKLSNGNYTDHYNFKAISPPLTIDTSQKLFREVNEDREKLKEIVLTMKDKLFMEVSNIVIKKENIIDDISFASLNKLLQTKDTEMFNLGLISLLQYDYEESKVALALLLHNSNFYDHRNKINNIRVKTFLNKIRDQFYNCLPASGYYSRRDTSYHNNFYFTLKHNHPENPFAIRAFEEYGKEFIMGNI